MAFDNPQENDGQRYEDDPRDSGAPGMLLRMMDPQVRQAAGMSAYPAAERGAEPEEANLPSGEPAAREDAGEASSGIGNRIVEIQANAPGRIPRQSAGNGDTSDGAQPDLRVVDAQRAQTMNDLPADLFKPSRQAPVLAPQDGSSGAKSGADGQVSQAGGAGASGTDGGSQGAQQQTAPAAGAASGASANSAASPATTSAKQGGQANVRTGSPVKPGVGMP